MAGIEVTVLVTPRMCPCCDPPRRTGTWDANSAVSGIEALSGYHCWQATSEDAAAGVERAMQAVFPES